MEGGGDDNRGRAMVVMVTRVEGDGNKGGGMVVMVTRVEGWW